MASTVAIEPPPKQPPPPQYVFGLEAWSRGFPPREDRLLKPRPFGSPPPREVGIKEKSPPGTVLLSGRISGVSRKCASLWLGRFRFPISTCCKSGISRLLLWVCHDVNNFNNPRVDFLLAKRPKNERPPPPWEAPIATLTLDATSNSPASLKLGPVCICGARCYDRTFFGSAMFFGRRRGYLENASVKTCAPEC